MRYLHVNLAKLSQPRSSVVEQLHRKQKVLGSIPRQGKHKIVALLLFLLYYYFILTDLLLLFSACCVNIVLLYCVANITAAAKKTNQLGLLFTESWKIKNIFNSFPT